MIQRLVGLAWFGLGWVSCRSRITELERTPAEPPAVGPTGLSPPSRCLGRRRTGAIDQNGGPSLWGGRIV